MKTSYYKRTGKRKFRQT